MRLAAAAPVVYAAGMARNDQDQAASAPTRAKTVKAKLRVLDHKNQTVHTRWGQVKFDGDGCATVDVPEDELQMLRDTKPYPWLDESADDRARWAAEEKKIKDAEKSEVTGEFDTSDVKTGKSK